LRMTKQQLHPALKDLKKKRVVNSRPERDTLLWVVTLEELLNRYVKTNLEQAESLQETKEELLANWRNMDKQYNA